MFIPANDRKIRIPPLPLCSENILTGSSAWQTQRSHYSKVCNCVLACKASNTEPLRRSSWHQRKVGPVAARRMLTPAFCSWNSSATGIAHKYTFTSSPWTKLTKQQEFSQMKWFVNSGSLPQSLMRHHNSGCARSGPPNIYPLLPKFKITVSYDCALNRCAETEIQCCCSLHPVVKTPPTHRRFWLTCACCIWFLTFVLKFCCENHSKEMLFEENCRVCLCFGHTWFIVLRPVLATLSLNRFFSPTSLLALAWTSAQFA